MEIDKEEYEKLVIDVQKNTRWRLITQFLCLLSLIALFIALIIYVPSWLAALV
jgi:fatty acid desaturase